jgi:hypothetical protein
MHIFVVFAASLLARSLPVAVNATNKIWGSTNATGNELVVINQVSPPTTERICGFTPPPHPCLSSPLRQNDPAFIAACGSIPTGPCFVNIGVFGWGSTAGYTVSIATTMRQLSDGIPLPGYAVAWSSVTYYYIAQDATPFTISVAPLSGDPDL